MLIKTSQTGQMTSLALVRVLRWKVRRERNYVSIVEKCSIRCEVLHLDQLISSFSWKSFSVICFLSAALLDVGPQTEFSRFGSNVKAQEQIRQISSPECCVLAGTRVSGSSAMRLHFVPIHIFRETP